MKIVTRSSSSALSPVHLHHCDISLIVAVLLQSSSLRHHADHNVKFQATTSLAPAHQLQQKKHIIIELCQH
jgi:hypothetical protein